MVSDFVVWLVWLEVRDGSIGFQPDVVLVAFVVTVL